MLVFKDEAHFVQCLEPVLDEVADGHKRLDALEKGSSRIAGESAAEDLIKMVDHFRASEPVPVSALPHIAQQLAAAKGFGLSVAEKLPEIPQ